MNNAAAASVIDGDGESLVRIEDYMPSFDGVAARHSIQFMRQGIQELKDENSYFGHACGSGGVKEVLDNKDDTSSKQEEELSREEAEKCRQVWIWHQQWMSQNDISEAAAPTEETPLLV
jgi:hypothetical protein